MSTCTRCLGHRIIHHADNMGFRPIECPTCRGTGGEPDEINPDQSMKTESYLERSFLDETQPLAPKGGPGTPGMENPDRTPPRWVPREGTTILEVVAHMPVMSEKGRSRKVRVEVIAPALYNEDEEVVSFVECDIEGVNPLLLLLNDTIYHMAKENNLLRDANVPGKQNVGQGFSYPLGAGFDLGSSVFPDDPAEFPTVPMSDNPRPPDEGAPPVPPVGV